MPQPEVGRFEPEKLRPAGDAPVRIEWKPGTLVRLTFSAGSIVDVIPPIVLTGVVAGVAAFFVAGWLEFPRWLSAILVGAVAIAIRTVMEKRRVAPHEVVFDWHTRSATFTDPDGRHAVSFSEMKELILRGSCVTLANTGSHGGSHTEYWCELVAAKQNGEHSISVTRREYNGDEPYQMLAPMAAELGAALRIPWRWKDYESTNSILDSIP
jgi:hypothetical protein